MIWFIPGVIAGASIGVVVAGMLAAAKDCEGCSYAGPIVRSAYRVADAWRSDDDSLAVDIALADALHDLADACGVGRAVR